MKWFFDCKYVDTGYSVDLVSVGMINERGKEYHAVAIDGWSSATMTQEQREILLPCLPYKAQRRLKRSIALDLLKMTEGESVEIWGYQCAYPYVCLSQVFGTPDQWPAHWEKYYTDLYQIMKHHKISTIELPKMSMAKCHALAGASWTRKVYKYLKDNYSEVGLV